MGGPGSNGLSAGQTQSVALAVVPCHISCILVVIVAAACTWLTQCKVPTSTCILFACRLVGNVRAVCPIIGYIHLACRPTCRLSEKGRYIQRHYVMAIVGQRNRGWYAPVSCWCPDLQVFKLLQVISACAMSFAHGANDVANAIGGWMQCECRRVVFYLYATWKQPCRMQERLLRPGLQ